MYTEEIHLSFSLEFSNDTFGRLEPREDPLTMEEDIISLLSEYY